MADEKKNGFKKVIIFISSLVILGVAVYAGVYIGLNKNNQSNLEIPIEEAYFELGEIFVNLSDDGGKRYVKLTATVSYDSKNKDLATELENKKVVLRDTAIFYFKSLTAKDFENELPLKKKLVEELNYNLSKGLLIDAKFNELLIQ